MAPRSPPGHRRVQHGDAVAGEDAGDAAGLGRGDGAHVDHRVPGGGARAHAAGAEHDFAHVRRVGRRSPRWLRRRPPPARRRSAARGAGGEQLPRLLRARAVDAQGVTAASRLRAIGRPMMPAPIQAIGTESSGAVRYNPDGAERAPTMKVYYRKLADALRGAHRPFWLLTATSRCRCARRRARSAPGPAGGLRPARTARDPARLRLGRAWRCCAGRRCSATGRCSTCGCCPASRTPRPRRRSGTGARPRPPTA